MLSPLLYDNFLPDGIADQLGKHVSELKWAYGWKSSPTAGHAHWNCDIAQVGIHNGLDVSHKVSGPVMGAWNFIKSNHLPDYDLIRCYANAHTYGVEGYPHVDSFRDSDMTVVIYMNRAWKREWGGETVIYNDDKIELAAIPAFNRAVIFNGNQSHCARGVTRICPDSRQTIMFKCAKSGVDTKRDKLQIFLESIGADTKGHKYGNLISHLLNTYDLLKAANQTDTVCLAGGAHSIFGTNAYKQQTLSFEDEDRLVEVIGLEATELVKLFSKINRPSVLENNNSDGMTEEQLANLRMIESANLYDQRELTKYPNLSMEWAKVFRRN